MKSNKIKLNFFCSFLSAKANWKGYIVDVTNEELEFPGGGIVRKNFFDYFKISFYTQSFKRYTVRISDILQMTDDIKIYRDKEGKATYTYLIKVTGSFGAVNFSSDTEEKRNELYGIIASLNEMGTPVANR